MGEKTRGQEGKQPRAPNSRYGPFARRGGNLSGDGESAVQYFRYNELVKYTNILKYSAARLADPRIMPVASGGPRSDTRTGCRKFNDTPPLFLEDPETRRRRSGGNEYLRCTRRVRQILIDSRFSSESGNALFDKSVS